MILLPGEGGRSVVCEQRKSVFTTTIFGGRLCAHRHSGSLFSSNHDDGDTLVLLAVSFPLNETVFSVISEGSVLLLQMRSQQQEGIKTWTRSQS